MNPTLKTENMLTLAELMLAEHILAELMQAGLMLAELHEPLTAGCSVFLQDLRAELHFIDDGP